MRIGVGRTAVVALVSAGLVGVGLLVGGLVRNRARPDYHRDIVPIFAQHCLECHRGDGVARGIRLDDERSARPRAAAIRQAVAGRIMPPFAADNTGFCGTWRDPRWLASEEIASVLRWTDDDTPPKDGPAFVFAPPASSGLRVDRTVDLGGSYAPGAGGGGYRCFVGDPKLDSDRFLRAMRVVSTDPRGVAQVNLYALDADGEAEVVALDQADEHLGYPCYGSARTESARLIAAWTASDPVVRLPDDTGVRLAAGRKVVIQMRYDILSGGPELRAETRLELELAETAREARVLRVRATGTLPPRQGDVRVRAVLPPVERQSRVVGVTPWMHDHGRFMQLQLERAGAPRDCLATFDHWRPRYQRSVFAVEPSKVAPNDRITLECAFETFDRDRPVALADTIEDEECVAHLFVVDDGP
jgi:hypothetical protein